MTWHRGPIGFLDFETTGVDPKTSHPVSYAVGVVAPDEQVDARHALVDAKVAIPKDASKVHGITRAMVKRHGVSIDNMLTDIHFIFDHCVATDTPVVIMNACFDWPLLNFVCDRMGVDAPTRPHLIDPLVLDRHFDRYRKGSRNLTNLVQHYLGESLEGAHDALADCLGSVRVARVMGERYDELRARTPRQLQMPQRRMHAEWARRMAQWRRERGQEPWPYLPWPGWPYVEGVLA